MQLHRRFIGVWARCSDGSLWVVGGLHGLCEFMVRTRHFIIIIFIYWLVGCCHRAYRPYALLPRSADKKVDVFSLFKNVAIKYKKKAENVIPHYLFGRTIRNNEMCNLAIYMNLMASQLFFFSVLSLASPLSFWPCTYFDTHEPLKLYSKRAPETRKTFLAIFVIILMTWQ